MAIALGLITFVAVLTYMGRDGYIDPEDDSVSLLDAFYYSTVSITTTGYGDIRPITDSARLVTTVLVTPARIVFLILLVGTTIEFLAERSRQAYRLSRWRKNLNDHVIICGYGTKGRSAVLTLIGRGGRASRSWCSTRAPRPASGRRPRDSRPWPATPPRPRRSTRPACATRARWSWRSTATMPPCWPPSPHASSTPKATIVAAVREEENVHLLHQSGANSVITSSGAAGRLLGHAVHEPGVTEVLEDLLSVGEGLDIAHRRIEESEAGPLSELRLERGIVVGLIRDEELIRFDDPRAGDLLAGDQVVYLHSHRT